MKLSKKEKEEILKAYTGDLTWLDTISKIVKNKENNEDILKLLDTLYHINYVIVETETEDYASKYNLEVQDIYSKMKIDLTKMLDYEEMWEEL